MKFKKLLIVLVSSLALISCSEDKDSENIKEFEDQKDNVFASPRKEKINTITLEAGAYEKFLNPSDNKIGFHSMSIDKSKPSIETKSIFLNNNSDFQLKANNKKVSLTKSEFKNNEFYGKTVKFNLSGINNSGKSMKREVEMYIPEKLNITKPLPEEGNTTLYAFYDKFELNWNADPNNKEGLMVSVLYDGSNVIVKIVRIFL